MHEKSSQEKVFSSETIRWMKLIFFIHAYDIIFYINCDLFLSGKNYGCYGNFFILMVIPGQKSGERLQNAKDSQMFPTKNTSVLVIFNSLVSSASTKHLINDKMPKQLHNTKLLLLLHIS